MSGADFNPVITLADRFFGGVNNREVAAYLPALVAQLVDGSLAVTCAAALYPDLAVADDVIVPQTDPQQEKEQLS